MTRARLSTRDALPAGGRPPTQDRLFVTALARGLQILRCFNAKRTELGTMEMSQLTALPQPTVWRLCHTLVHLGYLTRSAGSDKLRIGIGALSLGYASLASVNIGHSALHDMQRLADDVHAASSIAIPDGSDMVVVKRVQCDSAMLVVNLHVGSRLPIAYSSFGGAYVAVLPEPQREQLMRVLKTRHQRNWALIAKNIAAAIERYGKRGYIINRGAYHPQINAVAIPIASQDLTQVLAINCGGPATVLTPRMLENEVAPRLLGIAAKIRSDLDPGSIARRSRRDNR